MAASGNTIPPRAFSSWPEGGKHASERLVPLRCRPLQRGGSLSRALHALPLFHMQEDRRKRWLRYQSRRKGREPIGSGEQACEGFSRAPARTRPAGEAVARQAPFLGGMRQSPVALGPTMAGAYPSACLGHRYAAAEAARSGGSRIGLCPELGRCAERPQSRPKWHLAQ